MTPRPPASTRRILAAAVDALEPRRLMAAVVATTPFNGQQKVTNSTNISVTFDQAMNVASFTSSTVRLLDAAGNTVATTVGYDTATKTLVINPSITLSTTSVYYTARITGGAAGVKDAAGGALGADVSFSFTAGTPSFGETAIFTGLQLPTAFEFAPDGRIFVAEKRGVIKVFDNLTDTTPTIFADLRTGVYNYWDRGLLGMTLDPGFATGRPYVYVLYTSDSDLGGQAPKWGAPGVDTDPGSSDGSTTVTGKLSKLTASGNVMTGSEQVLIHDWQNQFPSHSIGDLNFGPDGYLYASAGDGASFNAVDYGQTGNPFNDPAKEGGAVRSQDILSPGDSQTLDGTVIRVDPDTGNPAPGNPYANLSQANQKRIIATGLRNPYRFTFRPGSSEIWIAETGWSGYEEINRINSAGDSAAENFGWPAYEGPVVQAGYKNANLPLIAGLINNPSLVTMPWFSYAHSEKVAPGSSEPTGGSSPTGIAFYNGGAYPAAYEDAMFFADYSRRQIYVMYRGLDGLPDKSTRQVFRAPGGAPVDLNVGPDGALYYADHSNGQIVRLGYAGDGVAPTSGKLVGTPIGTAGLSGAGPQQAFDGNVTTSFNGGGSTAWVGLDLGVARWVRKIRYYAPNSGASRMVGGKFQASSTADFSGSVVDLATITATPAGGYNTLNVNPTGQSYRYVRYVHPASNSNIAEIELYAGDGLSATYFDNKDLSGPSVTRIDPSVNFNFGDGSPDPAIGADTFSARWSGKIQSAGAGTYTFRVTSDDGIRVWVGNSLVIDRFIDQSPSTHSGTITLAASTLYDIKIEYYENTGGAVAQLEWQKPAGAFETVPTSHLFSTAPTSNTPPVATITAPDAGLKWRVGDAINFSGSATDAQDGALPPARLSWAVVLMHDSEINPGNPHEHVLSTFDGVSGGSFAAPDHAYPSWLEVRMTATDNNGAATTVTRRVDPLTRVVTLASNVSGVPLGFNDSTAAAPVNKTWIAGSVATISAPQQYVAGDGTVYVFSGWSDGGALSHDVTVPATNVTFTATYALAAVPTAPTNLTATGVSSSRINLTWSDNATNETGYGVERRLPGGTFTVIATLPANTTSLSDLGLAAGMTFEYRVRALGAAGQSAYSATASASTVAVETAPAAPTNLVSANVSTTSVAIAWADAASNETGYRVERRSGGGAFATVATLAADATGYTDTGLTPATAYEYRVRAFNAAGDSAASNTLAVTTTAPANGVPTPPANLAAAVLPGADVKLTWTDTAGNETGFKIFRRYAGWIWAEIAAVGANTATYTDIDAIGNVTYEYRVQAYNATGASGDSNVVLVNTVQAGAGAPLAPTNVTATAAGNTQVAVAWDDNATTEIGYEVDRRLAGGTWALLATTAAGATSHNDTTATAGTAYEYRVRAKGTSENSSYGNVATVTTPGGSTGIPLAPSGLTGAMTTKPQVSLSWRDNSSNETSFTVQRRYAGWVWNDVATVAANTTTFVDTTGIGNVTYEYRVFASSAGGSSPFSNGVIVSTE
ncbi:MAG TPA: PQQ-dependent sugar dehydrogenase [Tepidisphaeraceae bacterium]|jgi:glucose/arabinose dehydrogenase/fibronectin type 3 domain-containing protein